MSDENRKCACGRAMVLVKAGKIAPAESLGPEMKEVYRYWFCRACDVRRDRA